MMFYSFKEYRNKNRELLLRVGSAITSVMLKMTYNMTENLNLLRYSIMTLIELSFKNAQSEKLFKNLALNN